VREKKGSGGSASSYTVSIEIDGEIRKIGYNVILRSGDKSGDGVSGLLMDNEGKPVVNKDGSDTFTADNDFSSLLPVEDKFFMVSHFESRPGAMYLTELELYADLPSRED
jgi:hypothetical protein